MIITINLLSILKWYFIGSIVGVLIVLLSKDTIKSKRNILLAILISWLTLVIPLSYLRDFIVNNSKKVLPLYWSCMLNNYLYFNFNKYYTLKDYFREKYRMKHPELLYEKKYFEPVYWDKHDNSWDNYQDMIEYYFIERYNK